MKGKNEIKYLQKTRKGQMRKQPFKKKNVKLQNIKREKMNKYRSKFKHEHFVLIIFRCIWPINAPTFLKSVTHLLY